MNLRPPGPQPGALPDCATPRSRSDSTESQAQWPSGRNGNIRSWRTGLPPRPEPADGVGRSCRSRTSPGVGRPRASGTTTAASAERPTNESTTRFTASATLPTPPAASRRSLPSAPHISSSFFASGLAQTAARRIRSFSSSIISGTRTSTLPGGAAQSQLAVGPRQDRHMRCGLCELSSSANRSTSRIRARGDGSTGDRRPSTSSKRATGIEPALKAWKAFVQPKHFARAPSFHPTAAPRPARRPNHRRDLAAAKGRTSCRARRRA